MAFVKTVRPPTVKATDSTESVVRAVVSLCDADGESALLSDRIMDLFHDEEDIMDVVALLKKCFRVKPPRSGLSKIVTLGDMVSLFDECRKASRGLR